MKIKTILISFLVLLISGCGSNQKTDYYGNNSNSIRISRSMKELFYGKYENNKSPKTILQLYDKAYFTYLADSSKTCFDYDIDGRIIRFYNPQFTYDNPLAGKLKTYKENDYDMKSYVIFYDIVDTTMFKGLTEEFKKTGQ
jgi:hypothetical protein